MTYEFQALYSTFVGVGNLLKNGNRYEKYYFLNRRLLIVRIYFSVSHLDRGWNKCRVSGKIFDFKLNNNKILQFLAKNILIINRHC